MACLVVLAWYTCCQAIMPIEQRFHLAFRLILDALVGVERRLASVATRERDRSQLNNLEFTFLHSQRRTQFQADAALLSGTATTSSRTG
jgi:hypothetical protein